MGIMKRILISFITLSYLMLSNLFAQKLETNPETGKLQISKIIQFDSASTAVLYKSVYSWVALRYHDSKSVIQMADKENNRIICKGNFRIPDDLGMEFSMDALLNLLITFDS